MYSLLCMDAVSILYVFLQSIHWENFFIDENPINLEEKWVKWIFFDTRIDGLWYGIYLEIPLLRK